MLIFQVNFGINMLLGCMLIEKSKWYLVKLGCPADKYISIKIEENMWTINKEHILFPQKVNFRYFLLLLVHKDTYPNI